MNDCNEIRICLMKMGEMEGAGGGFKNMKVRVEKKVPNVMKAAAWKIYRGQSGEERWNVSPLCCNKPPAARVRGWQAGGSARALSHLQPGVKPIFQPRDNKTQGYRTPRPRHPYLERGPWPSIKMHNTINAKVAQDGGLEPPPHAKACVA